MTKILKLKQGTPGQESYKTKLDTLRANGEISAENDALIQKIAQNANTWAEERMKDASKRERKAYQDSLYESMYNIATGGQGYDPYGIGNDTVRQIVADTYAGKEYTVNRSGTPQYIKAPHRVTFNGSEGTSGNSSGSGKGVYWFNKPAASITGNWAGLSNNDLKGTILSEGNKWLSSLQQVLNAKNQGMVVQNYGGNIGSLTQESLDSLGQFLNHINTKGTADYEDIGNFARIMSVLTPSESEYFNSVFQPYIDAEPIANKNWRDLKAKGYTETTDTHDYLTQNKYHVLQDSSGKKYIYDENYNLIETPVSYIDRETNYGIFSDGTNTFIGDINDETLLNDKHPLYKAINDYKKELQTNQGAAYEWGEHYDPESTDLYKALHAAGKLTYDPETGKGTSYMDVSNMFDGDNQIIAINNDGSTIKRDKYGEPDLSDATLYYWDGEELKSTTKKTIDQNYDRKGYNEDNLKYRARDTSELFEKFGEDNMDNNRINADADIWGQGWWDRFLHMKSPFYVASAIKDDPQYFADTMILSIKATNEGRSVTLPSGNTFIPDITSQSFLNNFGYNQSPENAMAIIGFILNNKNMQLSKEDRNFLYKEWNKAYKKAHPSTSTSVQTQKQGGILKGEKGLTADYNYVQEGRESKKDDNIGKAQEMDVREFSRNSVKDELSAEDYLRLTSLAGDLAGAVAAFVPGAGTMTQLATGVGSTLADLTADTMDDSTSLSELGMNLVTNLGFTVAGMVPGVKLSKVAKSVVKWAPRIMSIISASNLALNSDIHDSLAKLNHHSEKMTVQDWKNVITALTTVLNVSKTGKHEWDNRTVKKAMGKGKFTKNGLTNKDLSEEQIKDLNKALKNGDVDEARRLAKEYDLNTEEFEKILKDTKTKKRTWDAPFKKKEVYSEIEFTKGNDKDALMKLWKEQGDKYTNIKKWIEMRDASYEGKSGGWYDYQMSKNRATTEAAERAKKLEWRKAYMKGRENYRIKKAEQLEQAEIAAEQAERIKKINTITNKKASKAEQDAFDKVEKDFKKAERVRKAAETKKRVKEVGREAAMKERAAKKRGIRSFNIPLNLHGGMLLPTWLN